VCGAGGEAGHFARGSQDSPSVSVEAEFESCGEGVFGVGTELVIM